MPLPVLSDKLLPDSYQVSWDFEQMKVGDNVFGSSTLLLILVPIMTWMDTFLWRSTFIQKRKNPFMNAMTGTTSFIFQRFHPFFTNCKWIQTANLMIYSIFRWLKSPPDRSMACFQSYIIAGGASLLLQDTVVVPTQYVHRGGPGERHRGVIQNWKLKLFKVN